MAFLQLLGAVLLGVAVLVFRVLPQASKLFLEFIPLVRGQRLLPRVLRGLRGRVLLSVRALLRGVRLLRMVVRARLAVAASRQEHRRGRLGQRSRAAVRSRELLERLDQVRLLPCVLLMALLQLLGAVLLGVAVLVLRVLPQARKLLLELLPLVRGQRLLPRVLRGLRGRVLLR